MENSTNKIIEVFNDNCKTIREKQQERLLAEKRKLFKECFDEISEVDNKSHNELAVEKFKSLLFKLEDHSRFILQEQLEFEAKRFLKAMYANILINNKKEILQQHTKELEYDVEALDFLSNMVEEKDYKNETEGEVTAEIIEDVAKEEDNDELFGLLKELEGMI